MLSRDFVVVAVAFEQVNISNAIEAVNMVFCAQNALLYD